LDLAGFIQRISRLWYKWIKRKQSGSTDYEKYNEYMDQSGFSLCVIACFVCDPWAGESQENANQPSESSSAEAVAFPYDFVNPQSSEELMKMEFPETLDLRDYDLVTPVRL
jgi:hypothetical protein